MLFKVHFSRLNSQKTNKFLPVIAVMYFLVKNQHESDVGTLYIVVYVSKRNRYGVHICFPNKNVY